ncbi:hypothetical protein B7494_g951 [Chlorociboria aeruginascens]|nr:hypothetical protein B7494_g951 [Chlorociboria aeruginascens]
MPSSDCEHDELTRTLTENFNFLADEVQLLSERKTVLEHKLRYAHEQYQYLADKYAPADSEISSTLAKLQLPPDLQVLAPDHAGFVPLPRRQTNSKQHTAVAIRDGRRASQRLAALGRISAGSTPSALSLSGTSSNMRSSARRTSLSTVLEQDFTVQGKKSSLLCPFAMPDDRKSQNENAQLSTMMSGRPLTPSDTKDPTRHQSADPICAALYAETMNSPPPSVAGSAAKCPIRFLDQHSPEEVARYFETHKHEIPRSHEVCVKRYQRNEEDIKKLDAKYGNLVSMIQGLGQKHQPMLPTKEEEEALEMERTSNERVENWANAVSIDGVEGEDKPTPEDDRESRFDRSMKEVRVGESPSRPWGISVPIFGGFSEPRPLSPPPAPVSAAMAPSVPNAYSFGHGQAKKRQGHIKFLCLRDRTMKSVYQSAGQHLRAYQVAIPSLMIPQSFVKLGLDMDDYKQWIATQHAISLRSMEERIVRGQTSPGLLHGYTNKELPPTPEFTFAEEKEIRISLPPVEQHKQRPIFVTSISDEMNLGVGREPILGSENPKSSGKRDLPPPPSPPMSRSEQKIFQLTGYDPTTNKIFFPDRPPSPASSDSSGSVYSQDDGLEKTLSRWSSDSINSGLSPPLSPKSHDKFQLKPTIYSSGSSAIACPRDSPRDSPRARSPQIFPVSAKLKEVLEQTTKTSSSKLELSLNDIMATEHLQYETDSRSNSHGQSPESWNQSLTTSPGLKSLIPEPLTIRSRPNKLRHISELPEESEHLSFLTNARDSMRWGIRELTTPTRTRNRKTSSRPLKSPNPYSPPPTPPEKKVLTPPGEERRRRDFATGMHPLKSPFPFDTSKRGLREKKSDGALSRGISDTLRHFPRSAATSPTEIRGVQETGRRRNSGSDAMRRVGFMANPVEAIQSTNAHFQEVLKKARGGDREERRRKALKKKIVLVGLNDQSPDGRVAEWL